MKEQRERFNRERSELDATVAALSAPLRARIERLRAEDPDFRWKWEAMMLPIYVDADRIVSLLCREQGWTPGGVSEGEAKQAVEAFMALSVDQQNERIPELHGGHSGASFGEACQLAFALLAGLPV